MNIEHVCVFHVLHCELRACMAFPAYSVCKNGAPLVLSAFALFPTTRNLDSGVNQKEKKAVLCPNKNMLRNTKDPNTCFGIIFFNARIEKKVGFELT